MKKISSQSGFKKLSLCFFSLGLGVSVVIFFACSSPNKTDLRSLAPAQTLIYLETDDLGETLQFITQTKSFQQLAKTIPDFSALKNIQAAVVVMGFETSEKQVTDESAILNFKPRFALMADTHAWESTAVSLVENQLTQFVKENYSDQIKLEKSEKKGAKFYAWTADDGRKIFAGVMGSIIYLGNDEKIIDQCLAVRRGAGDNLLKNENLTRARERAGQGNLAFGYVSSEAVAQLANLAGVSAAIDASEDDSVRGFIVRILPTILQKTIKEAVWTARKTEQGIEDKILIKTDAEVSSVWKETLIGGDNPKFEAAQFLPNEFNSITRYNLQSPQIAWRSVLLTASKQLDGLSGKILTQVSGSFFEPYGVTDIENFLSSISSEIVTVRLDEEGEKSAVIAEIKDAEKLKKSLTAEINFKTQTAPNLWQSADKTLSAAFIENKLLLGETETVLKCLKSQAQRQSFTNADYIEKFRTDTSAVTITEDSETAEKLVEILANPKAENKKMTSFYLTETRFDANGIERKTVSDFGLIGTIIEQFGKGN